MIQATATPPVVETVHDLPALARAVANPANDAAAISAEDLGLNNLPVLFWALMATGIYNGVSRDACALHIPLADVLHPAKADAVKAQIARNIEARLQTQRVQSRLPKIHDAAGVASPADFAHAREEVTGFLFHCMQTVERAGQAIIDAKEGGATYTSTLHRTQPQSALHALDAAQTDPKSHLFLRTLMLVELVERPEGKCIALKIFEKTPGALQATHHDTLWLNFAVADAIFDYTQQEAPAAVPEALACPRPELQTALPGDEKREFRLMPASLPTVIVANNAWPYGPKVAEGTRQHQIPPAGSGQIWRGTYCAPR